MAHTVWRAGMSGMGSLRELVVSDCYRFVSRAPTAASPVRTIRQLLGIPRKPKARQSLEVKRLASGHFLVSVTSPYERIQAAWRCMGLEWNIRRIVPSANPSMSIEEHYRQKGGLAMKNPFESVYSRGSFVYRGGLPTLGKRR